MHAIAVSAIEVMKAATRDAAFELDRISCVGTDSDLMLAGVARLTALELSAIVCFNSISIFAEILHLPTTHLH